MKRDETLLHRGAAAQHPVNALGVFGSHYKREQGGRKRFELIVLPDDPGRIVVA